MTRAWWLVVMLAACGDNSLDDVSRSGSRLRVEWNKAEDGAELETGRYYDRERQEFCEIQKWSDGVKRCTRLAGYVAYLDAACTQPAISAGTQGEVANDFDPATCSQRSAWVAGAPLATTTWYELGDTGCMGPYTNGQLLAADHQIDPDTFSRIAVGAPHGDGRIQAIDYTSADGFRVVDEFYDSALATRCNPGDATCSPLVTYDIEYLDAACTKPIAVVGPNPCGETPTYAAITDPVCFHPTSYHRLGDTVAVTTLHTLGNGTCMAAAPSPTNQYLALGDTVTPPQLSRAVASASGRRLQPVYFAGEGIAAPSGSLYDTQVGVECYWQTATDGATRCLPFAASIVSYYADTSCTKSVDVALAQSAQCATVPLPQFAVRYVAPGSEVHEMLGHHDATLYQRNGNACEPFTAQGEDFYDIDPRIVDPSSFEMSELVLEP